MLLFLVSCLSFLLVSQSLILKQKNQPPKFNSRMWVFLKSPHRFFILLSRKRKILNRFFFFFPSIKKIQTINTTTKEERKEEAAHKEEFSLLDLPDLPLDAILEKLSPFELCSMARVCSSLKLSCTSDHLWRKQMEKKWGGVIGDVAHNEWRSQLITASKRPHFSTERSGKFQLFLELFMGKKSDIKKSDSRKYLLQENSVMAFYLALETGKFWFPAQVFNRQNGHVGFMLSCYDAQLCYDSTTDNFIARYRAQGRSMIEEGIEWDRIRAPSVNTPPNSLHISDCLDQIKPGDHIEIQWRKNKEFPFGWWYGVVEHLESCNGNEFNCQCHITDAVSLEFKQYSRASRWRRTVISRKDHTVIGNEIDGFYGGIRKLCNKQEIAKWKQLWPNCTLE
ncbi:hypothetical protein ABFS82_10G153100 [Erythranthe guttata]|uniref:F-box protein At2g32560-like isoform X2 n=1 Tax=Erythranthe guttata TaxID=4155 RepID=UPI00064DA37E|nr:PREDICTED: F-box protein At2g32560-like isoform X2 [Erythranthe guttata]|eukprot:XP_012828209.1 PREDICTED: F-box protein At2g32560-like isoform X2 [Erythranthe guttata]